MVNGLEAVSQATLRLKWMAPGVRLALLSLAWEDAELARVGKFLNELLPELDRVAEDCRLRMPNYRDVERLYAAPGFLETRLDLGTISDLSTALLQSPAVWDDTYLSIYLGLNANALLMCRLVCDGDPESEALFDMIALLQLRPDEDLTVSLARFANYLGLPRIDENVQPADLVVAIRSRVGESRDLPQSEFFVQLARSLRDAKFHRQVVAIAELFFDTDYDGIAANRDLRNAVAKRLLDAKGLQGRGNAFGFLALGRRQSAGVIERWYSILKPALRSIHDLVSQKVEDAEALFATQCRFLDAIVGWRPHIRFDPAQLDDLLSLCDRKPFRGCVDAWVESLDMRGLLGEFAEELLQRLSADPAVGHSDEWWERKNAVAWMACVGAAFDRLAQNSSLDAAFDFLFRCRLCDADGFNQLGAIAANSPNAAFRRVCLTVVTDVAFRLLSAGFYAPCAALVERVMRIAAPADYASEQFSSDCRNAFDAVSPSVVLDQVLYILLAVSLMRLGRGADAGAVLDAALQDPSQEFAFDLRKVDAIEEFSPGIKEAAVGCLIGVLQFWNRLRDLKSVLEQIMALPDVCAGDPETIAGSVRRFLAEPNDTFPRKVLRMELVCALALAIEDRNPAEAVRLLECALGADGLSNPEASLAYTEDESDSWALALVALADPMFALERADRYLALSRPFHDSTLIESPRSELARACGRLSHAGEWIVRDYSLALRGKTLAAMRATGEVSKAKALAWLDLEFLRAIPDDGSRATDGALMLASEIARLLVDESPETVQELQSQFLNLVADVYGYVRTSDIDRLGAAARSTEMRRICVETGNSLAVATHGESTTRRLANFLTDSSLSQQVHLLRYLRGTQYPALPSGPTPVPGRVSRRQRTSEGRQSALDAKSKSFALDQIRDPDDGSENRIRREPSGDPAGAALPHWSERIPEERLARYIGPRRAVLRAGFSLDGQLVWSLVRSDGRQLHVVAHDRGQGTNTDKERILAALARYERRVEAIWDLNDCDDAEEVLALLEARIAELASFPPSDARDASRLAETIERLPRTWNRLLADFGDSDWSPADLSPPARRNWSSWWVESSAAISYAREKRRDLLGALDSATADLLADVEAIWPWADLAENLRDDDELVLWVEDALLGIPFSFLKPPRNGGESFLFESVDCIRTIVSPLLDEWMRIEDSQVELSNDSVVTSLSWFGSGGLSEIESEASLGRTFSSVVRRFASYEWTTAGGACESPGHHDVLARGLAEASPRRTALLAVCGHGHDRPAGVELGDGVWDGSEVWWRHDDGNWRIRAACTLSDVDLLVQISCSIGRLKQDNLQDVNGFCAELFLNRARSVVAGRWPLHAADSIRYAGWIAHLYLQTHAAVAMNGGSLTEARARGRAMAAVRKRWIRLVREGRRSVGLNTVAGFDLYGLA